MLTASMNEKDEISRDRYGLSASQRSNRDFAGTPALRGHQGTRLVPLVVPGSRVHAGGEKGDSIAVGLHAFSRTMACDLAGDHLKTLWVSRCCVYVAWLHEGRITLNASPVCWDLSATVSAVPH